MLKNNTKSQRGFTIIEVLIVLAIAGLILLIVFLAVPALQRNARNTQYKNDAAQLLAAATEFTNNNNGTTPTASNSTAAGDAQTIFNLAKTKSITRLDITTGVAGTQTSPAVTFSNAFIVTGKKCGANTGAATIPTADSSTRALAMFYAVENSSGTVVAQCTES